jgi:hypothetical protein
VQRRLNITLCGCRRRLYDFEKTIAFQHRTDTGNDKIIIETVKYVVATTQLGQSREFSIVSLMTKP